MSGNKKAAKAVCAEILDLLTMLSGASVGNAGVLTLLHSAEAFGVGLRNANQSHAALSTVQLQALTNALIDLQRGPVALAAPAATAATVGYVAGAHSGAPVVT